MSKKRSNDLISCKTLTALIPLVAPMGFNISFKPKQFMKSPKEKHVLIMLHETQTAHLYETVDCG